MTTSTLERMAFHPHGKFPSQTQRTHASRSLSGKCGNGKKWDTYGKVPTRILIWRQEINAWRKCIAGLPAYLGEMMIRALFEKVPCYICGYNGAGYFQEGSHPCAVEYHALVSAANAAHILASETEIESFRREARQEISNLRTKLVESQERADRHWKLTLADNERFRILLDKLAESRADADRSAEALEKILAHTNLPAELRINGIISDETDPGGLMYALNGCREVATEALASRPEAAKARVEAVKQLKAIADDSILFYVGQNYPSLVEGIKRVFLAFDLEKP